MAGRALQLLLAVGALALGIAATGCGGGGGKSSASAVGGISTPGPTSATLQQADEIQTRLAKAGYVVRPVKLPPPAIRGPIDVAAVAHGPQQTMIALTNETDKLYASINRRLDAIRTQQRARAIAGKPISNDAVQQLSTLSLSLKDVQRKVFDIYVFNSPDDATTYTKQFDDQNTHVLGLPGTNDVNEYKVVGPVVYFVDAIEDSGKVTFDKSNFDKLVALAEGRA